MLIKIREGKFAGTSLVSIHGIKEIQGVKMADNGDIYIGAGTVFSHITNDAIIRKYIPVLGEAVDQVGGPQVRNIGTIGGNICNGAVSAFLQKNMKGIMVIILSIPCEMPWISQRSAVVW